MIISERLMFTLCFNIPLSLYLIACIICTHSSLKSYQIDLKTYFFSLVKHFLFVKLIHPSVMSEFLPFKCIYQKVSSTAQWLPSAHVLVICVFGCVEDRKI